jgi:pimeloyl-ACP methyl ester carboxylesterase
LRGNRFHPENVAQLYKSPLTAHITRSFVISQHNTPVLLFSHNCFVSCLADFRQRSVIFKMRSLYYTAPVVALASIVAAAPQPIAHSKGFQSPIHSLSSGGKATCVTGIVPIRATASNTHLNLDSPENQNADTEIFVEYFQADSTLANSTIGGARTVTGTYHINAKLCFPTKKKNTGSTNFPTVQFLIHGVNFDKLYWDLPGSSYLDAAAAAGYPTFSYDRLGTGLSDHPDPIQVVQSAIQVEIAHQMIKKLRSGAIGGYAFDNVVGVGHSYGSIQAVGLAVQYPKDLDAMILQGFSINTSNLPATVAAWNPTIASQDSPRRFKNWPHGYQVINSIVGDQTTFFRYPNFDESLFDSIDAYKQPFTLGEFFTLTAPVAPATSFTGPVQVVNGENDFIFCASDCTYPTDQGQQAIDALFPRAGNGTTSYVAPGTGHAINAHNTARATFRQMIDFIQTSGF